MPPKKVHIPENLYNTQRGAIEKLTGTPPQQQTQPPVPPAAEAETPPTPPGPAETPQQAPKAQVRNVKPTSFYLTPTQLRKLDDLAYTYNGRTGKRVNRNDIVRHLVDSCDIGNLQGL
jgi:hypothetical protein